MTRARTRVAAVGLGIAIAGVIAVPTQAEAATGTTLYVNGSSAACTDSGAGGQSAPFCTIQAAANAANAGDTVLITGPEFVGTPLTLARSGTASAPIVFESTGPRYGTGPVDITGSYVELSGAEVSGNTVGVTVSGSHVTLNQDFVEGDGKSAVLAAASVTGLTVQRSILQNGETGSALQLSNGDLDTVITTDIADGYQDGGSTPLFAVNGASNTDITSNTIADDCAIGVSVTDSKNTSIENNIIEPGVCTPGGKSLSVDSPSSLTTTEGYNLLSTDSGTGTPYTWAGKPYTTQSAFAAATGEGTQDSLESSIDWATDSMSDFSAAEGTGNASALGEPTTDMYGNAWPHSVPDRGAFAIEEYTGSTLYASAESPQGAEIQLDLQGASWSTTASAMSDPTLPNLSINWGDGTAVQSGFAYSNVWTDFSNITSDHLYAQVGTYTITVTWTDSIQTRTKTVTFTSGGSTYVPITPTRVLDTRNGTGAPKAKVGPNGTIAVNVTNGVTLPANSGTISAVVMNVTATDETGSGVITAYPDGGALPAASNLNFPAHTNIPNLVTVKVGADGKVALHNGSSASTDLLGDVEGYYVESAAGSYYLPNTPTRVLDTRKGTGGFSGAVGPNATISLSISQCKSTATAVALNVTAVSPTANGVVTVYPATASLPNSSNLNYSAGETVPNAVVVEVGSNGKVDLHNGSSGSVQLVADLEGCYSTTLGSAFVPITPYRALDTRSGTGQESVSPIEVPPDSNATWWFQDSRPEPTGDEVATVLNVTVTQPQAGGEITAYPSSGKVPTASNLNFEAGQTVPNLVMVASPNAAISLYNGSKGKTQLIADVFGYFS